MLSKINLGIFRVVFAGVRPPPTPPLKPAPAVTPKFKRDDRCIVMGIDFVVIGAADFNNDIRFYVRRPTRRSRVTRRPPSHQNIKKTTDVSLWVLILGLLGPLVSLMPSDFTSAAPPAVQGSPAARRHTKILRI